MNATLNQIHVLANERFYLYRLAGRQRLTDEQSARISLITDELEMMWDRYRRELVAERGHVRITERRAA